MASAPSPALELLYPFYLDADMSMAFAAALTGGVALEEEKKDQTDESSQAVRNLKGNVKLFRIGGVEAARDNQETAKSTSESTLVRRHTEASIFIALYDELRRTGRVSTPAPDAALEVGSLVTLQLGPAVAPLRRVIDQVIRLIDVMNPVIGAAAADGEGAQTRQAKKQALKQANADNPELTSMRALFVALRDDLDQSGMIDIVVSREDLPDVVLTLDKAFLTDKALELLHTSTFTVVGKVTQTWASDEEYVNLYRRSSISLVPALRQLVANGVFQFLVGMGKNLAETDDSEDADEPADVDLASSDEVPPVPDVVPDTDGQDDADDLEGVLIGDDVSALIPAIFGPAVQILPLAICT